MWQEMFYEELFLSFKLRTASFLFDLFAKAINWILIAIFCWTCVIHYLDDFFTVLPPYSDSSLYCSHFDQICTELGLQINHDKDIEGQVADFMGFEFDTEAMVVKLPEAKLTKEIAIVENILIRKGDSSTRRELESVIDFLF